MVTTRRGAAAASPAQSTPGAESPSTHDISTPLLSPLSSPPSAASSAASSGTASHTLSRTATPHTPSTRSETISPTVSTSTPVHAGPVIYKEGCSALVVCRAPAHIDHAAFQKMLPEAMIYQFDYEEPEGCHLVADYGSGSRISGKQERIQAAKDALETLMLHPDLQRCAMVLLDAAEVEQYVFENCVPASVAWVHMRDEEMEETPARVTRAPVDASEYESAAASDEEAREKMEIDKEDEPEGGDGAKGKGDEPGTPKKTPE